MQADTSTNQEKETWIVTQILYTSSSGPCYVLPVVKDVTCLWVLGSVLLIVRWLRWLTVRRLWLLTVRLIWLVWLRSRVELIRGLIWVRGRATNTATIARLWLILWRCHLVTLRWSLIILLSLWRSLALRRSLIVLAHRLLLSHLGGCENQMHAEH